MSNGLNEQSFREMRPRPAPPADGFMPAWTWEELELAVLCMPLKPPQRLATPSLLAAMRLASPYQSPIATLKEMVALVSGLGEDLERIPASASSGESAHMP